MAVVYRHPAASFEWVRYRYRALYRLRNPSDGGPILNGLNSQLGAFCTSTRHVRAPPEPHFLQADSFPSPDSRSSTRAPTRCRPNRLPEKVHGRLGGYVKWM